jgi:hypothetical protein
MTLFNLENLLACVVWCIFFKKDAHKGSACASIVVMLLRTIAYV